MITAVELRAGDVTGTNMANYQEKNMPAPKRPTAKQLQTAVDKWNAANPVGTMVSYQEIIGEGETHRGISTAEAQILSGHSAVIWMEGKRGCVCLEHCTAV